MEAFMMKKILFSVISITMILGLRAAQVEDVYGKTWFSQRDQVVPSETLLPDPFVSSPEQSPEDASLITEPILLDSGHKIIVAISHMAQNFCEFKKALSELDKFEELRNQMAILIKNQLEVLKSLLQQFPDIPETEQALKKIAELEPKQTPESEHTTE
jgi:hypothetical protein